jgi:hypothetical protein
MPLLLLAQKPYFNKVKWYTSFEAVSLAPLISGVCRTFIHHEHLKNNAIVKRHGRGRFIAIMDAGTPDGTYYKVSITLKRVQSFIFDVPRLKAMLGANALIGETLRHKLTELASKTKYKDHLYKPTWPSALPCSFEGDPLADCLPVDSSDLDDPKKLFEGGIVSRDGGHFEALFSDLTVAREFSDSAIEKIAEQLPGVMFDVTINGTKAMHESGSETAVLDLPVFQVCQATGHSAAAESHTYSGGAEDETRYVAASVKHRFDHGTKFYSGNTKDIIGLLSKKLYPDYWRRPVDLADLAAGDYIALIHADGNGIGNRSGASGNASLEEEAEIQAFFHSMRVAVRNSLVTAIEKTFEKPKNVSKEDKPVRPYEILMLGGDDLVLVCRANLALQFANHYAAALEATRLSDHKPLDVAIGVAITKHNFPISRVNKIAEALQDSAKRLSRGRMDGKSVIDWQVINQSWFDDVGCSRKQSELVTYETAGHTETLVLSQRPVTTDDLTGLIKSADKLGDLIKQAKATGERPRNAGNLNDSLATADASRSGSGRSPLKGLRAACTEGRLAAEMAYCKLEAATRKALGGPLWTDPMQPPNASSTNPPGKAPTEPTSEKPRIYTTRALDTIDIHEISRLGSGSRDEVSRA